MLEEALASLKPERDFVEPIPEPPPPGAARTVKTAVPLSAAATRSTRRCSSRPAGFHAAPQARSRRASAARRCSPTRTSGRSTGPPPRSWRSPRSSPTASPIRLTGEDVERGTFSHRHAVFHDADHRQAAHPAAGASRRPRPRSRSTTARSARAATVGFEFGYNVQEPDRLVVWEAQYGDFINGAQVIIDEFITSGRAKWGLTPSLVLLLPHGYEGQGPDHSSARPERFLEAAADINLRLANCTTAAQYFHLLRRQALLLDDRSAAADRADAEEPAAPPDGGVVAARAGRRPLAAGHRRCRGARRGPATCAGWCCAAARSTSTWSSSERARGDAGASPSAASSSSIRSPPTTSRAVVAGYPNLQEIVWLQEEPENMGAWEFVAPRARGAGRRSAAAALHRPPAQRQPVGRLGARCTRSISASSSSRRSR